ncbi:MAG: PAS domain S-box protein [Ignavibacteriaceae bacterium]
MKIRTKLILTFSFFVILFLLFGMVINILFEKQVKEHAHIHAEIYSHTIALTIGRETEKNKTLPMFYNKETLEDYIQDVHSIQKLDIVVVDTDNTIVADVIKSEIGKKYTYDKNNEVLLTMKDDSDRTFKEISSDYPQGILLYVHTIKNENGKTLGAVLIEYTSLLKESEASINNVRQIILYAILFSVFVSIAFGFIISKKITGSIVDVVNAARKFSHGDYSVRIQTERKDELGELGKAFNQMIEQKLKYDEQILFLGNALKYTNDMIAISDINFNIIYVNAAFCKGLGYTEDEIIGKNVSMFRSEKNTIELNKIVNPKTFSTGWFGEQWSKTKNGKEFLVELHISPVKNLKDEVIATIAIFNNITERKATEAILKHSSDQLKLLNEIGRKVSSTLELELILDLTTKQVHEKFGYDHVGLFLYRTEENQLEIKSVAGVFSFVFKKGAKFSLEKGMVAQTIRTGKTELANDVTNNKYYINNYPEIINSRSELAIPLKIREKVIGVLDIQCKRLNVFDKNDVDALETLADQISLAINNSLLYESIQHELREKIKAEEALRESEEKYRLLFTHVPIGIAHVHSTGIITDYNDVFLDILGITKEDVAAFNITHLEDIKLKEAYKLALSGIIGNYEGDYTSIISKKITSLRVSFAPIVHEDGEIYSVVGIFEDISERKQIERFFFHDILNTASNLKNCSELINDDSLEKEDRDYFTKQILIMSNQIIEEIISHRVILSSDKTELKLNIVALNTLEFIKNIIINFKQMADKENKKISISDKFEDLEIKTDRVLLSRIISNLIKNAIEASQTGGIISVGCSNGDGLIKLSVHNQTEIPEEIQPKIFHRSFSTKGAGRGIGTYSLKFLTEKYLNGKVFFTSNGKDGTTFYVNIPSKI